MGSSIAMVITVGLSQCGLFAHFFPVCFQHPSEKILGIFLLCILLSPHELYVLFVFLNRTIVPKSYQNQSVLVYVTTSMYIYTVYVYILSITSRE